MKVVMQELNQKGYLIALQGKNGGCSAGRPPIIISGSWSGDGEDLAMAECFGKNNQCVLTPLAISRYCLPEALRRFLQCLTLIPWRISCPDGSGENW